MAVRKKVKITIRFEGIKRKRILDGLAVVLPGHEYAPVVAHRALGVCGQEGRNLWEISEPLTGMKVSIMATSQIEVAISMASNRLSDLKMDKAKWDENIKRNLEKLAADDEEE